MAELVERTIHLKVARYRAGRMTDFNPRPLQEILAEIKKKTPVALDRHHPSDPEAIKKAPLSAFYNYMRKHKSGEVSFVYCTYTHGATPQQMAPDLSAGDADIQAHRIVDPETKRDREVVVKMHVIALGDVLLVEGVKGGGGVGRLAQYLTYLFRKFYDAKFPTIELIDAVNRDLMEEIHRGGGVAEIAMGLCHPTVPKGARFGNLLTPMWDAFGGASKFRVTWKGGVETLSEDDVLEAYEESEAGVLDNVVLKLKSGEPIKGFRQYKICDRVSVQDDGRKNPNSDQMIKAMRSYLLDLQTPDDSGYRVLTDAGQLAPIDPSK